MNSLSSYLTSDHLPPSMMGIPTLEAVTIPAGSFLMGGISEDKFVSGVELPQHSVTFKKPFAIGKTPVTQRQWLDIMQTLPENCPDQKDKNCPVVCVTHGEIMTYLEKLSQTSRISYRLPSEAEWEYSCRAGSSTVFPSGNNIALNLANFLYDERGNPIGEGGLTPVSHYPENSFGLCDLVGNVCEWTADHWHPNYTNAPSDGSAWLDNTDNSRHVIRGGAWDHLPRVLRASWRDWAPARVRWDNLGFRIAHDL